MEKIRVLHYIPDFSIGGIKSLFIPWYKYLDKNIFDVELLTRVQDERELDEYKALGGKYYRIIKFDPKRPLEFKSSVEDFFCSSHNYDIFHCHTTDPFVLFYAKKYGSYNIIYHAHTTYPGNGFKERLKEYYRKYQVKKYVTDGFACSEDAAKWAFGGMTFKGKPVSVIPNGVDTAEYKFDKEKRHRVRKELGWEGTRIVAFVGRLTDAKNTPFIMEIFKCITRQHEDVKCVVVGDGPELGSMKSMLEDYDSERILFLGGRNDVNFLMQGMDCLVLPSKWEGFPVVLVEAQCSGLPCVISDVVTKNVDLTDGIRRVSLKEPVEKWTRVINESLDTGREDNTMQIKSKGYDMADVSVLSHAYRKMAKVN